jgi:elongation factor P hydroxylase
MKRYLLGAVMTTALFCPQAIAQVQTTAERRLENNFILDLRGYLMSVNHPFSRSVTATGRQSAIDYGHWLCEQYRDDYSFGDVALSIFQDTQITTTQRDQGIGYLAAVHLAATDNFCREFR